jgi:tetratricopeptide (TPR) repeat protein
MILKNRNQYFKLVFVFLILLGSYSCTNTKDEIRRELNLGIKASYASENIKAIEHFENVIAMDSNNAEAYLNLGRVYMGFGDYDIALKNLDKAIDINPKYGEAYRSRAQLHSYKGDKDAACKDYLAAEKNGIENLYNYTKHCR